jgi:tetrahydromethanopterin S-methyltransferase subunit D
MMTLWALFGTTLNVSLRWLRGRIWLSALLGAISGPLAYYAGAQLGASTWHDPEAVVAILAVGWGVLMPLLVRVAVFFNIAIQQDPAHV